MSFSSLAITPLSGELVLISVWSAVVLALLVWIVRLEWRLKRLLKGGDGKSLEASIRNLQNTTEEFVAFRKMVEKYHAQIERRVRRSIQSIETERFNPFRGNGDGGNQSFAAAFVNEEGDGIVLSSLYARDRMSIFSKSVSKFSSPNELTEEERRVLEKSRTTLTPSV